MRGKWPRRVRLAGLGPGGTTLTAELVAPVGRPTKGTTHNGDGSYTRRRAVDAAGNLYETTARGKWRLAPSEQGE